MKKFLILTSNVGSKDNLKDPSKKFENCDYIAYVDKKYNLNVWEQRDAFKFTSIDSFEHRRNAKPYKILSSLLFPEYEYILWHDSNHNLNVHPEELLNEYGDFDLLLFKHADRKCLYEEIYTVKERNLDNAEVLDAQANFYINQKMPFNYPLFEMNCFLKKNNDTIKTLDLMWWEQVCKFSSRDQCSFTYCLWRLHDKLSIKVLNGLSHVNKGGNRYFSEDHHLY